MKLPHGYRGSVGVPAFITIPQLPSSKVPRDHPPAREQSVGCRNRRSGGNEETAEAGGVTAAAPPRLCSLRGEPRQQLLRSRASMGGSIAVEWGLSGSRCPEHGFGHEPTSCANNIDGTLAWHRGVAMHERRPGTGPFGHQPTQRTGELARRGTWEATPAASEPPPARLGVERLAPEGVEVLAARRPRRGAHVARLQLERVAQPPLPPRPPRRGDVGLRHRTPERRGAEHRPLQRAAADAARERGRRAGGEVEQD
eukprot:gene4017-biopygen11703